MRVIIIGGFLGSGKTTTILKLAKHIAKKGQKTAIIVNEIGEIGIDGEVLKTSGIETKELTEGCICCTLKYTMEATVHEINKFYEPDVLLIEPTGVAIPEQIREELATINIPMVFSPILTIIDSYRFRAEIKQVPEFIAAQLRGADILAINKIDLVNEEEIKNVENFLNGINPKAEKIKISANSEDDIDLLYKKLVLNSDYDDELKISNKQRKIENSAEFSNVSTCAGIYEIEESMTVGKANRLLNDIMNGAHKSLININNSFVGHIKIAMPINEKDTLVKISLTGAEEEPVSENVSIERNENEERKKNEEQKENVKPKKGLELYYMAAVTNVPQKKLENILKNSIELYLESYTKIYKKVETNKKPEPKIFEL
ncbi:MAG: GTP-binding protein [Methanosarcinaceae archaeon]|nr:GTP-binding protein [Methanosarcinaceae archaeon]